MKLIAKKISLLILGLMFLTAGCGKSQPPAPAAQPLTQQSLYNQKLFIKDTILSVQVVSSAQDMAQGLSGRESMDENQGMLFAFSTSTMTAFWMKDMNFDLDFIWINNNKIIGVTPDAPAPVGNLKLGIGHLPYYYPPSNADQVLEVNAGWTKKNNIAVGDEVRINN